MTRTTDFTTIPTRELNALILALEETTAVAQAEFNRLRHQVETTHPKRRAEDFDAFHEMERLRRVIENARMALEQAKGRTAA